MELPENLSAAEQKKRKDAIYELADVLYFFLVRRNVFPDFGDYLDHVEKLLVPVTDIAVIQGLQKIAKLLPPIQRQFFFDDLFMGKAQHWQALLTPEMLNHCATLLGSVTDESYRDKALTPIAHMLLNLAKDTKPDQRTKIIDCIESGLRIWDDEALLSMYRILDIVEIVQRSPLSDYDELALLDRLMWQLAAVRKGYRNEYIHGVLYPLLAAMKDKSRDQKKWRDEFSDQAMMYRDIMGSEAKYNSKPLSVFSKLLIAHFGDSLNARSLDIRLNALNTAYGIVQTYFPKQSQDDNHVWFFFQNLIPKVARENKHIFDIGVMTQCAHIYGIAHKNVLPRNWVNSRHAAVDFLSFLGDAGTADMLAVVPPLLEKIKAEDRPNLLGAWLRPIAHMRDQMTPSLLSAAILLCDSVRVNLSYDNTVPLVDLPDFIHAAVGYVDSGQQSFLDRLKAITHKKSDLANLAYSLHAETLCQLEKQAGHEKGIGVFVDGNAAPHNAVVDIISPDAGSSLDSVAQMQNINGQAVHYRVWDVFAACHAASQKMAADARWQDNRIAQRLLKDADLNMMRLIVSMDDYGKTSWKNSLAQSPIVLRRRQEIAVSAHAQGLPCNTISWPHCVDASVPLATVFDDLFAKRSAGHIDENKLNALIALLQPHIKAEACQLPADHDELMALFGPMPTWQTSLVDLADKDVGLPLSVIEKAYKKAGIKAGDGLAAECEFARELLAMQHSVTAPVRVQILKP